MPSGVKVAVTEHAYAKVNLALHVLGRRADGYHELDSIVAFAKLGDELTFSAAATTTLSVDGAFSGAVPTTADNLVLRAASLLGKAIALPPVAIHLRKNLPVASGIGGGSADAAAALRGLLRFAGQKLPEATLADIALSLGADVPVCLVSRACRMQGVGERLSAVALLPARAILLVNPGVACETAPVFKALGLAPGQAFGKAVEGENPSAWRNDLEAPACEVVPAIGQVLAALRKEAGFSRVAMSGSGATCFGLADDLATAHAAARNLRAQHPQWWVAAAELM